MSKLLLLQAPHFTTVHLRTTISSLISKSPPRIVYLRRLQTLPLPSLSSPSYSEFYRNFSCKSFDTGNDDVVISEEKAKDEIGDDGNGKLSGSEHKVKGDDEYPTGEFEFRPYGPWESFLVKSKMLFAIPWERVRKGSVLTMKLRGQVQNLLY